MRPSPQDSTRLQALIDLAAAGSDQAFGELLTQASERLLRLTRGMLRQSPRLRRWEATEDVFQVAALRLYRSLAEVRPPTVEAFFGLAAVQIRRTLIDLARHHFGPQGGATHHHSDPGDGANSLLEQQADPHGPGESLEDWARFHEAVERLPDDERQVFELLWYMGLPQREAATVLGIAVPTVQRRWYRAQCRLGNELRDGPATTQGATV